MAKKENKISINKLEKLIEVEENIVSIALNEETEMLIKKWISLGDVILFVDEVAAACVDESKRRYLPEVREFCIKRNIMLRYANFTLPANLDKQYDLIYQSGVVDEILKHIDTAQLTEICSAIDRRVEFMLDSILSVEHYQLSSVAHQLEEITLSTNKMFENTDISALTENLSKMGNINEEKLVQAVLESQEKEIAKHPEAMTLVHKENV